MKIISELKMSWQQYVDDQLLATKQVEKSYPEAVLDLAHHFQHHHCQHHHHYHIHYHHHWLPGEGSSHPGARWQRLGSKPRFLGEYKEFPPIIIIII